MGHIGLATRLIDLEKAYDRLPRDIDYSRDQSASHHDRLG